MDENKQTPPPMSITVEIDDKPREIFASFALVNSIAALVGKIENLPLIQLNPELREAVLETLLQERDGKGKITDFKKVDDFKVSLNTVQDLLEFASEHVLDFTLVALERAAALQSRNEARASRLKSTPNGQAA